MQNYIKRTVKNMTYIIKKYMTIQFAMIFADMIAICLLM